MASSNEQQALREAVEVILSAPGLLGNYGITAEQMAALRAAHDAPNAYPTPVPTCAQHEANIESWKASVENGEYQTDEAMIMAGEHLMRHRPAAAALPASIVESLLADLKKVEARGDGDDLDLAYNEGWDDCVHWLGEWFAKMPTAPTMPASIVERAKAWVAADADDDTPQESSHDIIRDLAKLPAAAPSDKTYEQGYEEAQNRYLELPVTEDSLDMASAFVKRWFGTDSDSSKLDAHELARMFDAVRKDAQAAAPSEPDGEDLGQLSEEKPWLKPPGQKPAPTDGDALHPECSGDPNSCPENEGHGCCNLLAEDERPAAARCAKAAPTDAERDTPQDVLDWANAYSKERWPDPATPRMQQMVAVAEFVLDVHHRRARPTDAEREREIEAWELSAYQFSSLVARMGPKGYPKEGSYILHASDIDAAVALMRSRPAPVSVDDCKRLARMHASKLAADHHEEHHGKLERENAALRKQLDEAKEQLRKAGMPDGELLSDSVAGLARDLAVARRQRDEAKAAVDKLASELDPPICSLQLPDGSVPGNAREAAEMWHAACQEMWKQRDKAKTDLDDARESIGTLRPSLKEITRQRDELLAEACRWYRADGTFDVLDSPEAVIEKRKEAAKVLARAKAAANARAVEELRAFREQVEEGDDGSGDGFASRWRLVDQINARIAALEAEPQPSTEPEQPITTDAVRCFEQGMEPPPGGHLYRKATVVRMWKQDAPFLCQSREGALRGEPGDFLAQDGHGGYYPVSAEFHGKHYESAEPKTEMAFAEPEQPEDDGGGEGVLDDYLAWHRGGMAAGALINNSEEAIAELIRRVRKLEGRR